MLEEFHADRSVTPIQYKLLYGWNRLNTNVWLPSLSELVGYDIDTYSSTFGTYFSAMQGLNTSMKYWIDVKGGDQFSWFKQFNASGGGEKLWNACNQQISWLRSPHCGWSVSAWSIENATAFNASGSNVVTLSYAVHPAARPIS